MLSTIEKNKDVLELVGSLASEDNSKKIDAIMKTAQKYTGSINLSQEQTQALAGRMKEWLTFGSQYDIFTGKADGVKSSVMFTYKTQAIEIPVQEAQSSVQTQKVGFVQRIKNLFK